MAPKNRFHLFFSAPLLVEVFCPTYNWLVGAHFVYGKNKTHPLTIVCDLFGMVNMTNPTFGDQVSSLCLNHLAGFFLFLSRGSLWIPLKNVFFCFGGLVFVNLEAICELWESFGAPKSLDVFFPSGPAWLKVQRSSIFQLPSLSRLASPKFVGAFFWGDILQGGPPTSYNWGYNSYK